MKDGPDIARLGSLIGDPARANILTALVSGKALTASELASEAGVTLQTASSHLEELTSDGLISLRKQGRHRYYTLADSAVSDLLESMMGVAAQKGHTRVRTGPKDPRPFGRRATATTTWPVIMAFGCSTVPGSAVF